MNRGGNRQDLRDDVPHRHSAAKVDPRRKCLGRSPSHGLGRGAVEGGSAGELPRKLRIEAVLRAGARQSAASTGAPPPDSLITGKSAGNFRKIDRWADFGANSPRKSRDLQVTPWPQEQGIWEA